MDWEGLNADVEMILPRNFTSGRYGSIQAVTIHHMAGDLSIEDCYRTWLNSSTSAHYAVQSDGTVGQLVNDWDTAWACGNDWANPNTISVEHANDGSWPWTVGEAALDAGAHLVAAICRKYGLGRPEWMVNVFPHSHWSATLCPGELAGSQNAEYMRRAGEWYDRMAGASGEWVRDGKGWWYRRADGSWPAGEWIALDAWYRFGADGYALTGWQLVDGKWYLFGDDCRMLTGWQSVGEKWYYLTGSGAMATGWADVDGTWYYLDESGAMQTGWLLDGGKWYWLDESGAMARSTCRSIGGKWYAFGSSGAMISGNVPTGSGGDMELG